MAQPNKYTPQTSFAGDVRANKPGRDLINAGALDRELRYIGVTANGLCDNLALLQRDDGKLKDAVVGVHTLHKDVLMLLGKYELFGTWVPNRPYLQGYVVDFEGRLYVCTESHDANDAMDLAKFKAFGSLTGDYLPVKWDESFFNADADSLTEAGVYVLKEGEAAGFLLVLGVAPNLGQVRVHEAGIGVRFKTANGWTAWADIGSDAPDTLGEDSENSRAHNRHTHKLDRATLEKAGIARLSSAIDSDSEEEAATPKAVKAAYDKAVESAGKGLQNKSDKGHTHRAAEITDFAEAAAGSVAYIAGSAAPAGWLKANGAAVSRTTYAPLFAAIGTRYGAGDGSSTFNLPDLRGEFIRGWDDGRGVDVGRALGSAQGDAIRNITGTMKAGTVDYGLSQFIDELLVTGAFGRIDGSKGLTTYSNSNKGQAWGADFDAGRVVPTAPENRPRNIALLAIVKI